VYLCNTFIQTNVDVDAMLRGIQSLKMSYTNVVAILRFAMVDSLGPVWSTSIWQL